MHRGALNEILEVRPTERQRLDQQGEKGTNT